MGRCLSTLFILFVCMASYAQTSMSEKELKKYLVNNIHNLHPIEGIYIERMCHNLSFKDETTTFIRAFIYSTSKGLYEELYFDEKSGKYKFLEDVLYDSDTHIFSYRGINKQYVVSNPSHFTLDDSEAYSYYYCEFSKLYPTEEMYKEAYAGKRIQEASNLLSNKYFSSALAILNDVLKTNEEPYAYYLRAGAYYGLKDCYSAIQDCNKALSFSIPSDNARAVYYLRGLCNFLVNNKEAGITDMKQAGEDGIKFLEEQGIVEKPSEPQRKTTQSGSSSKRANTTPILKKTK